MRVDMYMCSYSSQKYFPLPISARVSKFRAEAAESSIITWKVLLSRLFEASYTVYTI